MKTRHISPIFSAPLFAAAIKVECEKVATTEKGRRGRPIKIPDEIVLEIRKLYEWEGVSVRKIESLYPDIKPETIRQFISYQTRGNLLLPRRKPEL